MNATEQLHVQAVVFAAGQWVLLWLAKRTQEAHMVYISLGTIALIILIVLLLVFLL